MKCIKFLMVLAVMVSAMSFNAKAQNKKKAIAEVKYSVYLHCDDEKKKAEAIVPTIKGIRDLKLSVEEQSMWIKYDSNKLPTEKLVEELKKKGYIVKLWKPGEQPIIPENAHDHGHGHSHEGHNHSHDKHDHKHDHKHNEHNHNHKH